MGKTWEEYFAYVRPGFNDVLSFSECLLIFDMWSMLNRISADG